MRSSKGLVSDLKLFCVFFKYYQFIARFSAKPILVYFKTGLLLH